MKVTDRYPTFSGPDAQCAKCGHTRVDIKYEAQIMMVTMRREDWLLRTCWSCGYAWRERCIDAKPVESRQLRCVCCNASPVVSLDPSGEYWCAHCPDACTWYDGEPWHKPEHVAADGPWGDEPPF